MSKENPCDDCNIRRMLRNGCCTQLVDERIGTKRIRSSLGRSVEVCANLVVNQGAPFCGDYQNRPPECRAFECESILKQR